MRWHSSQLGDREGTIRDVLDVTWYLRLPGMDSRELPGDPVLANRVISFMCALRVIGADPSHARSGSPKIKDLAVKMFKWLDATGDPMDAYLRRLLLAEACEQRVSVARPEYYLDYAKWSHEQMTSLPVPERYKAA